MLLPSRYHILSVIDVIRFDYCTQITSLPVCWPNSWLYTELDAAKLTLRLLSITRLMQRMKILEVWLCLDDRRVVRTARMLAKKEAGML